MIQEETETPYDEVLQVADEEEDPEAVSFLQLSPRKRVVSLLAKPQPHVDGDRIVAQVNRKLEKSEDFDDMTPAQKQLARATALSRVSSTIISDTDPLKDKKDEIDKSKKGYLMKFL